MRIQCPNKRRILWFQPYPYKSVATNGRYAKFWLIEKWKDFEGIVLYISSCLMLRGLVKNSEKKRVANACKIFQVLMGTSNHSISYLGLCSNTLTLEKKNSCGIIVISNDWIWYSPQCVCCFFFLYWLMIIFIIFKSKPW